MATLKEILKLDSLSQVSNSKTPTHWHGSQIEKSDRADGQPHPDVFSTKIGERDHFCVRLILTWSTLWASSVPPLKYDAIAETRNDRHVIHSERPFPAGAILSFMGAGSASHIIRNISFGVADASMPGNLIWASCADEIIFGRGNDRLANEQQQSEHGPSRDELASEWVIRHVDGSPILEIRQHLSEFPIISARSIPCENVNRTGCGQTFEMAVERRPRLPDRQW